MAPPAADASNASKFFPADLENNSAETCGLSVCLTGQKKTTCLEKGHVAEIHEQIERVKDRKNSRNQIDAPDRSNRVVGL